MIKYILDRVKQFKYKGPYPIENSIDRNILPLCTPAYVNLAIYILACISNKPCQIGCIDKHRVKISRFKMPYLMKLYTRSSSI